MRGGANGSIHRRQKSIEEKGRSYDLNYIKSSPHELIIFCSEKYKYDYLYVPYDIVFISPQSLFMFSVLWESD